MRRARGVDLPGLRKYENVGESQPVLITQVGVTVAGVTFLYALTGTLGYALFGTVTATPAPPFPRHPRRPFSGCGHQCGDDSVAFWGSRMGLYSVCFVFDWVELPAH